jgi:tetratricopeptide (TPR) repeat protein
MSTSRKQICRASLWGVLLCIAAGCSSPTPAQAPRLSAADQAEALAHFSAGLLSERSGDSATALEHFQKAIRVDPAEAVLYPPAIASALRLQQNERALELCRTLRKKQPDTLSPLLLHAEVCVLTDRTDEANALFRKAAEDFPQEPAGRLALARFLIAREKTDEAVGILEDVTAAHADNAEALNLLGTLYIEQAAGLNDEAKIKKAVLKGIDLLEEALVLNPGNPRQWQQLGYAYLMIGDIEKIRQAFEKALDLAPEDTLIARQLLDVYIQEGKTEAALAICDELIRKTRTDPELWIRYLSEKLPEENRQELADYLQAYINQHADAPVLYYIQLGSLLMDYDRIDEAKTVLEDAERIYPADQRVQTIAAYLLVRTEQYDEAYALFRDVLENSAEADWTTSPFFTISFATAAQKSGHTGEAAEALHDALENDPSVLAGYMRILFSENTAVSAGEAVDLLNKLRILRPDAAEPFYYLTILQADLKDYTNALASAKQVEMLAQSGGETNLLNGFFYYQYGIINERTGQLEEAEALFRKAIDLGSPTTASSAKNYIAYMWAERGEKLDMGMQLVQQALETDPGNAAFIDTLGWIYYMKGDYEKALAELKKASEQIADDPVVWEHLGDTYLKLGNPCAAVAHWEKALELAPEETRLIEQIKKHSVNPDGCLESTDSLSDKQPRP